MRQGEGGGEHGVWKRGWAERVQAKLGTGRTELMVGWNIRGREEWMGWAECRRREGLDEMGKVGILRVETQYATGKGSLPLKDLIIH